MWSLTRPDAKQGEPTLVVDTRVTGATDDVVAAGVRLGMVRREAEALAPFARLLIRDPGEEMRRFESVVVVVEELVPRVEVVSPGLLFVPISGALKFYGDEQTLTTRVARSIGELVGRDEGARFGVGVADGPFAARWSAGEAELFGFNIVDDTPTFLSRLDLATLREEMGGSEMIDTFRWLGISTLGELARLPRETIASRFGNPGLLAHDLAAGQDRSVAPRSIPDDLEVTMSFEDPLQSIEAVAFAGRELVERMLRELRPFGVAPHTVTIRATSALSGVKGRVWRSADPFAEKALNERIRWQLRTWVETSGVPGGIVALSIEPSDLSGEGRQLGLLTDEASLAEADRAISRVQTIIGQDNVLQGRPQGGRMPIEQVSWHRWGEPPATVERDAAAPWPGATPRPTPSLVFEDMEPLGVEWEEGLPTRVRLGSRWEEILTWSGPWRLNGRWWAGEQVADRYQLVTSVGAFLCVVVDGRAFLAGIYD